MARKKTFLPSRDADLVTWLGNLSLKIDTYSAKYNLTVGEVTTLKDGCAFLIYWITTLAQVKAAVQNLTAFKNEVRDGVPAGGSVSVTPTNIAFTPPTAVPPGVIPFILSIIARIKAHQSYTVADGEQLGIEGAEQIIDLLTLKPVFTYEIQAGHPNLIWPKGIADAVKIKVFRAGGGTPPPPGTINFEFLAIDTQPDYLDTFPLPAFGQTDQWIYVMIYMIGDEEVGQWSEPVIVTVTGTP